MASFDYQVLFELQPNPIKAGETITAKASFSQVVGDIRSVTLSVPHFGMTYSLKPTDEQTYGFSSIVPWGAPSGTYDVRLYATDSEGNRGPVSTCKLTIT